MSVIADLLVKLGLDAKGFTTGVKGIETELGRFKKNAATIAKATATAVIAIGTASVLEFTKSQDAGANLASVLSSVEGGTEAVYNKFLDLSTLLQNKSTFPDEDITNAMANLIDMTGDYNFALKYSQTMVDMAARKGKSLLEVSEALGLAYRGNTKGLRTYGVVIDETMATEDAFEALQEKYAKAAESRTKTLRGQWAQVKNYISNMAEAIGGAIVGGAVGVVDFAKKIDKMDAASKEFYKTWEKKHGAIDTFEEEIESGNAWTKQVEEMNKKTAESKKTNKGLNDELKQRHNAWVQNKRDLGENKKADEDLKQAEEDLTQAMEDVEKAAIAKNQAMVEGAQQTAEILGTAMSSIVTTFLDSQATMNEKMAGLLRAGLTAVIDAVSLQIDAYMAAETAKAIATGGLSSGLLAGIIAQKVVVEGLKAAVGTISLAQGGIAYSPVNAVVGDSTSPEVVAPLHKLQPMITKAVNNSQTNRMTFVINSSGFDNADEMVRTKIAPAMDKYMRRRGGSFL